MIHSFVNQNNRYDDSDAKQTFKKINQDKTKFLSSIGDDGTIPECLELNIFFDSKLNVATTKIKNLILDAKICRIEAGNVIVDMNLKNFGRLSKEELRIGLNPLDKSCLTKPVVVLVCRIHYNWGMVGWEKQDILYTNNYIVTYISR